MAHYSGKDSQYEKTRTYTVRHADVHLPDPKQEEPSSPPDRKIDPVEIYNDGYYVAVINMANEADKWGWCFNCGKEGHCWAKCTEPLKESLKQAKERANRKKQSLNWDGRPRAKGAQPSPQTVTVKADSAKAKN